MGQGQEKRELCWVGLGRLGLGMVGLGSEG